MVNCVNFFMGNYAVNRKCRNTFGIPLQTKYSIVILDKNYANSQGEFIVQNEGNCRRTT